jgi:hypothetical protein
MSQENVEIVVGQFEAVNARDFKAMMDAYADDVTLVLHADLRGGGGAGASVRRRDSPRAVEGQRRARDATDGLRVRRARRKGEPSGGLARPRSSPRSRRAAE